MTAARFYSSVAQPTTTTQALSSVAPGSTGTLTVVSLLGYPSSFPYSVSINRGQSDEELLLVTGAAGTTLNITRGIGGTTPVDHTPGATLEHVTYHQDFTDAGTHIGATAGVHGATGSVVGTSDTQTLSNKTIDGGSNTLSNIAQASIAGLVTALSGKAASAHSHAEADVTSLVTDLAGKAASSHVHAATDVTGLTDAWVAYVPSWTASVTSPSNFTIAGRKKVVGKIVHFEILITLAIGFVAGNGTYSFGLPTTSANQSVDHTFVGTYSQGGSSRFGLVAVAVANGATFSASRCDTNAFLTASSFTYGVGDVIRFSGTYESA